MVGEIESRQILALANEGASSSDIAKSLNIEEPFVKLVLSSHNLGSAADRDINDEQLKHLRSHAFYLATNGSEESIQARMTMFLLERDKPSGRTGGSSITSINQALILANDSFNKLVESFKQ